MQSISSLCLLLVLLSLITNAQSFTPFCVQDSNYTEGSPYQSNLKLNLNSLVSNIIPNGFYRTTSGTRPDKVYGLLQCRGDVSIEDCHSCANVSSIEILKQCPNQKEAVIYFDYCMLHYADYQFFSTVFSGTIYLLQNKQNVSNSDAFSKRLDDLMNTISAKAPSDPKRFSVGTNFSEDNLYGLVQCTRDLSEGSCTSCLQQMREYLYKGNMGGQVLFPSCLLRYETYSFFNLSVLSPPPPPSPPPPVVASPPPSSTVDGNTSDSTTNQGKGKGKGRDKINVTVAIVIPILIISLLAATICFFLLQRKRKRKCDGFEEDEIKNTNQLSFDLDTLRVATDNFSESYKLGQGGFGSVYKGTLPDGKKIAVKRLAKQSHQGLEELKTEVELVAKLQHTNLVRLLGFCLQEEEKLLVYEYLINGSLDTILFDEIKRLLLDWDKRYKIIDGIARGLLYLHQDSQIRIIHRDLKASNILLDEGMIPKISDFGLARLFLESHIHTKTERIAGTLGYMPPEYVQRGAFSTKSDVFSFGVLVLEIVAGRNNSSFYDMGNLVSYAWQHWKDGTALDLVDPTLGEQWPRNEILKCIQIGLLCVQRDGYARPTMSEVHLLLNSYTADFPIPSRPAYFVERVKENLDHVSGRSSVTMSTTNSQHSLNEVTISDMDPR